MPRSKADARAFEFQFEHCPARHKPRTDRATKARPSAITEYYLHSSSRLSACDRTKRAVFLGICFLASHRYWQLTPPEIRTFVTLKQVGGWQIGR